MDGGWHHNISRPGVNQITFQKRDISVSRAPSISFHPAICFRSRCVDNYVLLAQLLDRLLRPTYVFMSSCNHGQLKVYQQHSLASKRWSNVLIDLCAIAACHVILMTTYEWPTRLDCWERTAQKGTVGTWFAAVMLAMAETMVTISDGPPQIMHLAFLIYMVFLKITIQFPPKQNKITIVTGNASKHLKAYCAASCANINAGKRSSHVSLDTKSQPPPRH